MRKARLPKTIILVVAFYLVAAISAGVTQQNWEFLKIYIPSVSLFAIIIAFMHRGVNFTGSLLWCMTLWGAMYLAGGLVILPEGWPYHGEQQILYSWWVIGETIKYDHIVHCFGFGSATWLIWEALRASVQHRLGRKLYPSAGMIALCIFAGMGLGAMNEIIEFIAVVNIPESNVGGYTNTCQDMISNLCGGLLAGILIMFRG